MVCLLSLQKSNKIMKKQSIAFLMSIIGIASAYCACQEFIKPKTKKVYVSEQQYVELDGEIIISATDAQGVLADILKTMVLISKKCLDKVSDHVNGEKSGLTKIERTERYEKKIKIKKEIEDCMIQMQQTYQNLSRLISALEW